MGSNVSFDMSQLKDISLAGAEGKIGNVDQLPDGDKLHMQSLAALAHFDFNLAGAYSYEQVFQVLRRLNLPCRSIEQQFRRMVFNIVAGNQDDHVKNWKVNGLFRT